MTYNRRYKSIAPQLGHGLPVIHAPYAQRGHGLGSFFGSLAKRAMPILKEVGKRVLGTGLRIAEDVTKGRDIKQSIQRRAKDAALQAGQDAIGTLKRGVLGTADDVVPHKSKIKKRVNSGTRQKRGTPKHSRARIKRRNKRGRGHIDQGAGRDIFD
jgi:hypothetical protein